LSTLSRVGTIIAVIFLLGILPLLSGRDIAASIFRTRYAEGEMTPEALDAIRRELGLEAGPLGAFFAWVGKAVQGDFGVSWT
ncbi:ABC transporter permease, partial [Pseudomonas sp. FW306-02-H05-AB]